MHGGKREGAGRPPVLNLAEKHTVTFSLPKEMKRSLDEWAASPLWESRSAVIRAALRRFLKL